MPKLYDVAEASKILMISPNTLRKWILQRRIDFIKLGNRVRFRESDLEKIMGEGLK